MLGPLGELVCISARQGSRSALRSLCQRQCGGALGGGLTLRD